MVQGVNNATSEDGEFWSYQVSPVLAIHLWLLWNARRGGR